MAKNFMDIKPSPKYQQQPLMEATVFFKNPKGKQPDFSGTGLIYINGESIPVDVAVWQNTGNMKIKANKK